MSNVYVTYGWVGVVTAIIAAKWALDLGRPQTSQLLWGLAAFFAAPLVLLILYVRLINHQARNSKPGG